MRIRSLIAVILYSALLAQVSMAQSLSVMPRDQEKVNWDWSAICQMVLDYHGVYVSQTAIAAWATPGMSNTGVNLYLPVTSPVRHSMSEVLAQFKGLATTPYDRPLTLAEVSSAIGQGRLVIAQKASGKFLVVGVSGNNIMAISPWPGQGLLTSDYTAFVDASGYPWTQSLTITTPRGARPSRLLAESEVPRTYPLYAIEQLAVNDRVLVFADPATATSYGPVASSWASSLTNTNGTYGIQYGVDSKTGAAKSSGPVWMRDRASIQGTLTMNSTAQLSVQTQTVITGGLVQAVVPYQGFGWGSIDFGTTPQTTVNIEPDRARLSLAPGTYWSYYIKQRSPVRLSAGDYFFNNLSCDGCTLEVDASAGPVRVYVASSMLWTGSLTMVGGGAQRVMFAYLGKSVFFINGSLNGTFIAPRAEVVIGQAYKDYTGMYMARKLTVHQDTKIHFLPFTFE